jgi:tRNA pseudouridine55 synthase
MSSGILLLDKPQGLSSNGALQRVRALYLKVKAGHIGSLDPLATGMLPICLGEATKVASDILAGRKRYRFTVRLGERTATGDAEGAVTARAAVPALSRADVEAVLAGFLGVSQQVPPMYSALKRQGRPLYELARAGIEVPRAARAIELYELALRSLGADALELEALCSKGTYIRSLAEDIAAALTTVGHVTSLRRLYVEPFQDQPMHALEPLREAHGRGAAPPLLPVDWPLQHLPALQLTGVQAQRLTHGQRIAVGAPPAPRARIYDADGRFLGVGETDAAGTLHPRRLINVPGGPSGPAP